MVLAIALASDGLVLVVGLFLLFYLHRVRSVFKGGTISRAFDYFAVAVAMACAAFGARLFLDVFSIDADALVVPIRDLGTGAIMAVLLLGLRAAARIWPKPIQ